MPNHRRSPAGAAAHVFAVRLTSAEHDALVRSADASSVKPHELFRAWIASGARVAAPEPRAAATKGTKRRAAPVAPAVPKMLWCSVPSDGRRGDPDVARRRQIEPDPTDPDRFTAARSKWFFSMAELLDHGSCERPAPRRGDDAPPFVLRVYRHKPSAEELAANGRERGERMAAAEHRRASEPRQNTPPGRPFGGGVAAPGVDEGFDALRSFGLDPRTATRADLQRAYSAAALKGHADRGGKGDMGELVNRRDMAREHIAARG